MSKGSHEIVCIFIETYHEKVTYIFLLHKKRPSDFQKKSQTPHTTLLQKTVQGNVELSLPLLTQHMVYDKIYSMFENSLTLLTLV